MDPTLSSSLRGAWAGATATVPMSAVMLAADALGLMGEHPPEVISEKALEAVGIHPSERASNIAASVAHLAFGAASGALFGLLHRRRKRPIPSIVQGIGFGLLVYTGSYNGWVPAAGLLPEPEEDRPGRQLSMALAHLVYGAVLGALLARRDR